MNATVGGTRRSADHGASFDGTVVAANDSAEVPFFLGPLSSYHRWGLAMTPDVEHGPGGDAHIAYTHDPVPGRVTGDDGDIPYIMSSPPPNTGLV